MVIVSVVDRKAVPGRVEKVAVGLRSLANGYAWYVPVSGCRAQWIPCGDQRRRRLFLAAWCDPVPDVAEVVAASGQQL